MNEDFIKSLELTFSAKLQDNTIPFETNMVRFTKRDQWLQAVLELSIPWGYHTPMGWKSVTELSIFPPLITKHVAIDEDWFDPIKYAENLYISLKRVIEFIKENPQSHLTNPVITNANIVYFQVMNLNTLWSPFTYEWTFDPEFTVHINGKQYPVKMSTSGLTQFMKDQPLLEVGKKIQAKDNIDIQSGLRVDI